MFFFMKNYEFVNNVWKHYNFETVEGRPWNLELRWGTYESFFIQIFEAIGRLIWVSEPKNEMPIVALNTKQL